MAKFVVERLHGPSRHPQSRIWILADLRERQPPPCLVLGVELLLADLTLDLGHRGHTIRDGTA